MKIMPTKFQNETEIDAKSHKKAMPQLVMTKKQKDHEIIRNYVFV